MVIIPITLREANEFIVRRHRHLGKAAGCKFALGLADEKRELIGVAVCGRPVSRYYDNGETLEICRVCTDGIHNACSMLYGACVRVGKATVGRNKKQIAEYIRNQLQEDEMADQMSIQEYIDPFTGSKTK